MSSVPYDQCYAETNRTTPLKVQRLSSHDIPPDLGEGHLEFLFEVLTAHDLCRLCDLS